MRASAPRPPFRKDIEGLRGIAVLLVVLYHAGVPGFSGGYVGVDVFFVLSGYLITGILAAEVARTGTLDLGRFYARRVRRLLPGMAVLLIVVTAFAFVFYAPMEQRSIAATATATAAYVSNFLFAEGATNYLAGAAEANPLLHTWSLSVEEQFYFFWPLLVLLGLAGFRRRDGVEISYRRLMWVMAAVCIASFALTLYLMGSLRGHWAFFSSPTRAWEFAIGGLGALLPRLSVDGLRRGRIRFGSLDEVPVAARALGWAGLAAILAAGVFYDARTPFPGWAALLPALGTIFALRAGTARTDTPMARILALRPLQEMGRLSYSWYLWHWPVLVFAAGLEFTEIHDLPSLYRFALVVLSLGLAEASYRFVENPARHQRWVSATSRRSLILGALLTAFSVSLGLGWHRVTIQSGSSPAHTLFSAAAADITPLYSSDCHASLEETAVAGCVFGPKDATRTIALFGDSHAVQWEPALSVLLEKKRWRLYTFTKSGCPAPDIEHVSPSLGRIYSECLQWRRDALSQIQQLRPDMAIVASAYGYGGVSVDEWRGGLERTLDILRSSVGTVFVLNDTPRPNFGVPACLSRNVWRQPNAAFREKEVCTFELGDDLQIAISDVERSTAAKFENARFIDLNDNICGEGLCPVQRDGVIVYRDSNHLTASFARSLAPALAEVLKE